jgi:hypothetical protein
MPTIDTDGWLQNVLGVDLSTRAPADDQASSAPAAVDTGGTSVDGAANIAASDGTEPAVAFRPDTSTDDVPSAVGPTGGTTAAGAPNPPRARVPVPPPDPTPAPEPEFDPDPDPRTGQPPGVVFYNPAFGPTVGNWPVVFVGDGFTPDIVVLIRTNPARVVNRSDAQMTVIVPPGEEGAADIVLQTSAGTRVMRGAFLYQDPAKGPIGPQSSDQRSAPGASPGQQAGTNDDGQC